MIYRMQTYSNDEGVIIQSRTEEVGPGDPRRPELFFCQNVLSFMHPQHGPAQKQFQFDIEAINIAEAFEKFPKAFADAKVKAEADLKRELQQEATRKQLIVPAARGAAPGFPAR